LEGRIGATAEAEIESLEPGPAGNVPAATISIVETSGLRGRVRVINELPTTGGGVKQVGVVTRADMDRVKAQLFEDLEQRAIAGLRDELSEQEFLPLESVTIEILTEVYDQFLDAEADVLGLQMRILATGTAVDKASANLMTLDVLKDQIPDSYELESEDVEFGLSQEVAMEGRSVIVEASASAQLVSDVDRRQVRTLAAGLTKEEAREVISATLALASEPEILVWPNWLERWERLYRVPYLPFRIQVIVVE
jgi:hypothetical protein